MSHPKKKAISVLDSLKRYLSELTHDHEKPVLAVVNMGKSLIPNECFEELVRRYPSLAIVTLAIGTNGNNTGKTVVDEKSDERFHLRRSFIYNGENAVLNYKINQFGQGTCFALDKIDERGESNTGRFPIIIGEVNQFVGSCAQTMLDLGNAIVQQCMAGKDVHYTHLSRDIDDGHDGRVIIVSEF